MAGAELDVGSVMTASIALGVAVDHLWDWSSHFGLRDVHFDGSVRFGSLIAMMLGVALIGDLLFLPVMLSRKA